MTPSGATTVSHFWRSLVWTVGTAMKWLAAPSRRRQAEVIRDSGLFDLDTYLSSGVFNGRIAQDPVRHFIATGAALGRKPHRLFDPLFYISQNPEAVRGGVNCLYHFVTIGQAEGRQPHPLFDPRYYAAQAPDDPAAARNPLLHFSQFGQSNRLNCHPLFDTEYYLRANPEVSGFGMHPLVHYLEVGASTGRTPHGLFDPACYLRACPDAAGSDPLVHYLKHASRNRCNPHSAFDTGYYLSTHSDIAVVGLNPLVHYVQYGGAEGRKARPRCKRVPALSDDREQLRRRLGKSGSALLEANSRYVGFRAGDSGTLDILFSLGSLGEGEFSFSDTPSTNAQIFLNTRGNDSYQRGIPDFTASIDQTAEWLRRVIDQLRPTTVRTMGESMGGYAALLFGYLLEADAIYATAPFIRLGEPYCRSRDAYSNPTYDKKYKDISPLLPLIKDRVRIVFPTYDLQDYQHMRFLVGWPHWALFHGPGLHPGGHLMNWDMVVDSPRPLDIRDGITWGRRHVLHYTAAQMLQIWEAYGAIRRREHATALEALLDIAVVDPTNHGILYRVGLQQALVGEHGSAVQSLQRAAKGLWERTDITSDRPGFFKRWRTQVALDYSKVVDLAQLRYLVNLFHEIWPPTESSL